MQRVLGLGLVLGLLWGCAGKNTVAGEDKTKAEQLEASLPSWCEKVCQRLGACGDTSCDCSGDVCGCTSVDDSCPSDCKKEMARYTTGGDECAAVGERFKNCIDGLSCEEFGGKDACRVSDADKALCPDDDESVPIDSTAGGPVTGPSPGSGGQTGTSTGTAGAPSTAGSSASGGASSGGASSGGASGGDSASGGASGGATGAPVVQCQAGYGTAGSPGAGTGDPTGVICEEGRDDCSDSRAYSWVCVRGSQGQLGCTCFVDSQVVGGFDPHSMSCPAIQTVNSGCGWNIAP